MLYVQIPAIWNSEGPLIYLRIKIIGLMVYDPLNCFMSGIDHKIMQYKPFVVTL
jgi:hypothetical protein